MCIILSSDPCDAQKAVEQKTTGDKSPNINAPNASSVSVTYGPSDEQLNDVKALLTTYLQNIKDDREKNDLLQKTLLDTVYLNNVNKDQLDTLIRLKHKDIFHSSTEDAKAFANQLMADLEMKKIKLEGLKNDSSGTIKKLYLKWRPFFEFFLTTIDSRIDELVKRDNKIQFDKNESSPIVYDVDKAKYIRTLLRSVHIDGKSSFLITYEPGEVSEGLCTKDLKIIISKRGQELIVFEFTEEGINLKPIYRKYKDFCISIKMDDPLSDIKLREKTVDTINLLVTSAYISRD